MTVTAKMSDVVAVPTFTEVNTPVASAVTFAGAVIDGGVVSTTVINCFAVAMLPLESSAVQVTVVFPKAK